MNTANLQLEGVYAILSALFGALRDKGVLEAEEIDALLVGVERSLARDPLRPRELRDANFEAICFPARLLRLAQRESAAGATFSFAQLAGRIGQETPPEQAQREPAPPER